MSPPTFSMSEKKFATSCASPCREKRWIFSSSGWKDGGLPWSSEPLPAPKQPFRLRPLKIKLMSYVKASSAMHFLSTSRTKHHPQQSSLRWTSAHLYNSYDLSALVTDVWSSRSAIIIEPLSNGRNGREKNC